MFLHAEQWKMTGKFVEALWMPPYRLDINKAARPGENRLEVDVANTWGNCLVDNANLPKEQRYCRTNITTIGAPESPEVPWKDVPCHKSRLLDLVRFLLSIERTISLQE